MSLDSKYQKLADQVGKFKKVAIAYSGGVDSTFLLKVLIEVLGSENVLACICVSQLMPDAKASEAIEIAKKLGATALKVQMDILESREFTANPHKRCYTCKKEIYRLISDIAKKHGIATIVSGTNLEDLSDFRPGNLAGSEAGIINPLADAKLTKEEIRQLSRKLNLPTANIPSSPCNASRIPYGQEITAKKLIQVGQAEECLKEMGFKIVRVRHYGELAKIEVPAKQITEITNDKVSRKIIDAFEAIGFTSIAIDIKGFRSGALNESLES